MTLARNREELSVNAIDDDLQSITGIWLQGFRTDFSDVIRQMETFAKSGSSAGAWRRIIDHANVVYGSGGPLISRRGANPIESVVGLLAISSRDYNFFNYLLGYGADNQPLQELLEALSMAFNFNAWTVSRNDFKQKLVRLITATAGQSEYSYEPNDQTLRDKRRSRLYLKLDLSEWIELHNTDVLHVIFEPAQSLSGYYPMGRTTVWLPANAQIQHIRSKTAKTFLRGQIAQNLKIEDLESSISNFVNTIFDTDSEQAYSSASAPC